MSSEDELELLRTTARGVFADATTSLTDLGGLGLLGLLVPEERGGSGWLPVEATVVADELGRAVSGFGASAPDETGTAPAWLGPTVAAAGLAVAAHRRGPAASTPRRPSGSTDAALLATTLDGTAPAVAVAGHLDLADGRVSGSLAGIELPEAAAAIVVLDLEHGLHVVDLDAEGLTIRPDPVSLDTTRPVQRVDLDRSPASSIGRAPAIHDAARVLAAAVSLGSLRAALERLVPYLSERVAFGAHVASFQAIQHRIVDLFLLEVRAGVAVDAAARALTADPAEATRLAAVAHAFVAEHVPPALDECIQLTGGIGFTWEYPLHHELRRSVADGSTFGSARSSREALLEVAQWM